MQHPIHKKPPESQQIVSNLLETILSTITNKNEKPEKFKKTPKIMLKSLIQLNKQPIIREVKFLQKSTKKEVSLIHLTVHQQFLNNLCGYHASFNLMESVIMLKTGNIATFYSLDQSHKYWSYVFETNRFLWNYGQKAGFLKWPWDYVTTHFGDFERSFLKTCILYHPRFISAFKNEEDFDIKFININTQFYNLLNEEWELENIQKVINEFINFSSKNTHKILAFMLGICNHWVSLLVHKIGEDIEFIFYDSRNVDYLTFSEDKIQSYIKELAETRIKEGKIPYNSFKIMVQQQSIRDIQRTLDLLMNCILGNTSLLKYNNDRRLDILYGSLQSEVPMINQDFTDMKYEEIFSIKNKRLMDVFDALNNWVLCNSSQMKKFFVNFHDKNDLDEEYNVKLLKFLNYFRNLYKFFKGEKIKFTGKYPYLLRPLKISVLFECSNL